VSVLRAPNGFGELLRLGDPRNYLGADGVMSIEEARQWETSLNLVLVPLPAPLQLSFGRPGQVATALRCHPIAADPFRLALRTIWDEDLWFQLRTFGGAFAVRTQRGASEKWSTHAWGLAADFDVANNPLGAEPRMSPAVIQIFESHGFTWGGRWRRPDGMHFQYCTGF
jgi:hypothetical protein